MYMVYRGYRVVMFIGGQIECGQLDLKWHIGSSWALTVGSGLRNQHKVL